MNKQLSVRKGIAWMIATPFIIFLATGLITLGIIIALFGVHPMSLATFGYFFAPFIFIGVLLVEIIIYWITCAIISIVKSIRKRRRVALQN